MTKVKIVEIESTSKSELIREISELFDKKIAKLKPKNQNHKSELLSRKSTAEYFGISPVTLDSWCKKGLLKSYRKGNRRYFRLSELEKSLTEIK